MARFVGRLELVSDVLIFGLAGLGNIHALRIEQKVLRNIRVDPSMHALLVPGDAVELSFGRMLWWRWLLRATTKGQSHRQGIFSFFVFNGMHALICGAVVGVASATFISSHALQADLAVIAGFAFFVLNLKAWLL